MRSRHRDEQPAQCATDRHHEIEIRQVPRVWLEPHQLSVANHAAEKKRSYESGDGPLEARIALVVKNGEARASQRHSQQRQEHCAVLKLLTLETNDEGKQVDAQRKHPQKRDRSYILAQ